MKRYIMIALAVLAAGCGTTKQDRCAYYSGLYAGYVAESRLRSVTEEEKQAAALAAAYLGAYCGWQVGNVSDHNRIPMMRPVVILPQRKAP